MKLTVIYLFFSVICVFEYTQENPPSLLYSGWWVYGEGQHIFKDEATLEEWNLKFPNENMQELAALYLAITEMEYFPMECVMTGSLKADTLSVNNFEITYIQGCGEE